MIINPPTDEDRSQAKEATGVMLPGVDPTIGEIVLSTFMANPTMNVGPVIAAVVRSAPEEIAHEVAAACLELLICKTRGRLNWVNVTGQDILVGIRSVPGTHTLCFGTEAHWPMSALLVGPPRSAVIRLPQGARRVWLAAEGLDGAAVRQSEAVALGNAMIESFGGRIIEDRLGPEVMQKSFIEGNMSKRAKARALALDATDRVTIQSQPQLRDGHIRVAMAEAMPGSCRVGMVFHPADQSEPLYEVERRINESWVLLCSTVPGRAGNVTEPCPWVSQDGIGPFGAAGEPDWGFTETPALARVEVNDKPAASTDQAAEGSGPATDNGASSE